MFQLCGFSICIVLAFISLIMGKENSAYIQFVCALANIPGAILWAIEKSKKG